MKKLFIVAVGLIVLGLVVVVLVRREVPQTDQATTEVNADVRALEAHLRNNPSDPAAPQIQRLVAALKAHPRSSMTVLGQTAAKSVEDGVVSTEEAAMLEKAAALAERQDVTEAELAAVDANPLGAPHSADSEAEVKAFSAGVARPGRGSPKAAIDTFLKENPAGPGVAQLRRISAAFKARPAQVHELAQIAVHRIEDGAVSKEDAAVLTEAAALAERKDLKQAQVTAFSERHPPTAGHRVSGTGSGSAKPPAAVIDRYIEKHPSGRGVRQLKRLSAAMKTRPAQVQTLAETAASRIQDGSVSEDDAVVLEKAATLAEREGWSPREMAEFSKKYMMGIGTSQKPASASMVNEERAAPLPSFEGKRQLTYTFTGVAKCATPCTHIGVSVKVSSGKWVEMREGGLDPEGRYTLQLPILSAVNEKITWRLEAHSKDLRDAELKGERITTNADKDVTVQNDLILNPT